MERPLSPYLVSWSGGKDSALALWRAWQHAGPPGALLTMFIEDGTRSRSHGLRPEVLAAQAQAMGLSLRSASTSWSDYERVFTATLEQARDRDGLRGAVFGDIDLEAHREWCRRVCANVGIDCVHPLWREAREDLLREFLAAGFVTRLVAVQEGKLSPDLLGKAIDADMLDEFRRARIDLCGENGEYHSVVTDGPCFGHAVALTPGERVLRDGYWFIDFECEQALDR